MLVRSKSDRVGGWQSDVTVDLGKVVAIAKLPGVEGCEVLLAGHPYWISLRLDYGVVLSWWSMCRGEMVTDTVIETAEPAVGVE